METRRLARCVHVGALALGRPIEAFMAFTSLTFICFVLVTVLLVSAARTPTQRGSLLLAASLVFLGSYANRPAELVPLLLFIAFGYVLIELLRRTRSSVLLWAGLTLVLGAFVWLKRYAFVPGALTLSTAYAVVGISYILFRVVHLMVDAKQGELAERIPLLSFAVYTTNFLTLTAGPIQRYPDFERDRAQVPRLDEEQAYVGVARVLRGFVKIAVLSAIFNYLFAALSAPLLADPAPLGWSRTLVGYVAAAACYTAFLYANFAGYMDVVIGIGGLMGLRLPENFERPFAARSFLDFWARWHITLSQWFRTYVFNPLLQVMARRISSKVLGPYLAVVAFFVTFLLMGIWHGATSVFVIYGLFMGAGASINKLWQVLCTKRLGKARYKAWGEKPAVVYGSRGLTFAYFAVGLCCLWLDLPELARLAGVLGAHGLLLGYALLAGGGALCFVAWDLACAAVGRMRSASAFQPGIYAQNLGLALQVLLIFSVSSFFHKSPEFVYRAF